MRRIQAVIAGACMVPVCVAGFPASAREARRSPMTVVRTVLPPSHVAPAASQGPAAGASECLPLPRATEDRPDFDSGRQVHLIYLVPSDATDDGLDADGTLECSIRAQQEWFAQQSDGLEWRLDTFLTEAVVDGQTRTVAAPDITFVASPQPAANLQSAGTVREELRARGFDDPDKRYLSYVESGSNGGRCGDALYPIPHLGERWGGQYAQVYLDASEGCGSDQFGVPGAPSHAESVAQQELMHNDGMTPPGAPHGCLLGSPPGIGHVCTVAIPISSLDPERFDVMYPYAGVPLAEKKLDIGHDDYFRHPWAIDDFADSPFLRPVDERPEVPQDGAPRSVSLEADRTSVSKGKQVRFSGTASGDACVEGAAVVLEARLPSGESFVVVAEGSTGDDGAFDLRARVRRTRVFRAVLPQSSGCAAATSPEIEVVVRG